MAPKVPAALGLVAPSWVKWASSPAPIGLTSCRMHLAIPHQAHGARNLPLSDSCADQAALLHDSFFVAGPTAA